MALYEADNTTHVLDFDQLIDPKWQEIVDKAELGSGSLTLPVDEVAQWSEITPGRVIQCQIDGVGAVFSMVPRSSDGKLIPKRGDGRTITFDCDGLLKVIGDAVVELAPSTKSFAGTIGKRRWSWAGVNFDDSAWDGPSIVGPVYDPLPPKGYLSPFSYKITAPGSTHTDTVFARYSFTLADPKVIVPRVTSAGNCKVSLNDVPLGETNASPEKSDENTWTAAIPCDAGDYVLAVEFTGNDTEIWFAAEVYGVDTYATGRLDTASFLFQTGYQVGHGGDPAFYEPWKFLIFDGTSRPAQTVGDVLIDFITEAHDRSQITDLTYHFSRTTSANGVAWAPMSGDFVTDTLRSGVELCQQLAASEADIWMTGSGGVELNACAWRERGSFHTSPATPPRFNGAVYGVDGTRFVNLSELTYHNVLAPTDITRVYRSKTAYGQVGSGPERPTDLSDIDATTAATVAAALNAGRDDDLDQWTIATFAPNGDEKFYANIGGGDAVEIPVGDPGSEAFDSQRVMSITVQLADGSRTQARYIAELSSRAAEFSNLQTRKVNRLRAGGNTDAISAPTDFGVGVGWKQVEEKALTVITTNGFKLFDLLTRISDPVPFDSTRQRVSRYVATMGNQDGSDGVPISDINVNLVVTTDPDDWAGTTNAIHTIVFPTGASKVLDVDSYVGDNGYNANQHPALLRAQITTDVLDIDGATDKGAAQMNITCFSIPAVA